jgi:hypothetical protein
VAWAYDPILCVSGETGLMTINLKNSSHNHDQEYADVFNHYVEDQEPMVNGQSVRLLKLQELLRWLENVGDFEMITDG